MAAFERTSASFENRCDRFILNTKNYAQQYNAFYLARLAQMRPIVIKRAMVKWGSNVNILPKIVDVEQTNSMDEVKSTTEECVVVGTVFKDMQLRGSVLDEFRDQYGVSGPTKTVHDLATEADELIMEDESGRIVLGGALICGAQGLTGRLVTGVVVAMRGTVDDMGVLQVTDWVFAHDVRSVSSGPLCDGGTVGVHNGIPTATEDSKFLMLVSGFHIGKGADGSSAHAAADNINATTESATLEHRSGSSELSVQLLMDFISGRLGERADTDVARRVVRLIVAGNSMNFSAVSPGNDGSRFSSLKQQQLAESPSKQLDLLLGQLLTSCDIDILPGETDPANLSLPQQPLHPCLFPHSCRFSSIHRVPNPYEANVNNIIVMGHSGQPVSDIARQRLYHSSGGGNCDTITNDDGKMQLDSSDTSVDESKHSQHHSIAATTSAVSTATDRLDILEDTLRWGHLSPTCPDTLACYPFSKALDPFVINSEQIPRVLFAGNQPGFSTRLVSVVQADGNSEAVRLICVPSFADNGMAVLVDINNPNLPCTVITFN